MLIQFSVKNFKSIKEKQTFSMVSNKSKELETTNTFSALNGKLNLVRVAAIYGPNASGKTSLFQALQTMKMIITSSAQSQRGDELPITPYLFDPITTTQPTEFSILFVTKHNREAIRYEYGFTATTQQILEEWLYAFPKGKAQTWISRTFNSQTQEYEWGNTEKLIGTKQLWQDATRPNALFLSTAIQLNNKQLQPVFDWFKTRLKFVMGTLSPTFTFNQCQTVQKKTKILKFLQKADFHIHDLDIKTESVELEKFLESNKSLLPNSVTAATQNAGSNEIKMFSAKSVHFNIQNDPIELDLDEESSGTQKFFAYAGPWLDVLKNGYVIVVDELNNSLHPELVKYLVQMFHDPNLNSQNAQLVFSTHETSILSQDLFRRDQFWFTEKDEHNATKLYPLSDFSPRKGVENLERNYLQGRYGAIPFLQTPADLFTESA